MEPDGAPAFPPHAVDRPLQGAVRSIFTLHRDGRVPADIATELSLHIDIVTAVLASPLSRALHAR